MRELLIANIIGLAVIAVGVTILRVRTYKIERELAKYETVSSGDRKKKDK